MAPGGVKLCPRRSQEVKGSLELQNGGPRALNEAWMMTFVEAFSCQVWSSSVLVWAGSGLAKGSLAKSRAVPGGQRGQGK